MTSSTAPFIASDAELAASKARHPAGRPLCPDAGRPLRFAAAVALLTGRWRVDDPIGFAAAMTTAGEIAGHPVVDLSTAADEGVLVALAGIAPRRRLPLWWVAGSVPGQLHVEARVHAPAGAEGPEILVLAHLVEPLGTGRGVTVSSDHSWVVVLVGDGSGGVAAIVRATLACPRRPRCCPPPVAAARFSLAALKARLVSPALEAGAASPSPPAAVLTLPGAGLTSPGVHGGGRRTVAP